MKIKLRGVDELVAGIDGLEVATTTAMAEILAPLIAAALAEPSLPRRTGRLKDLNLGYLDPDWVVRLRRFRQANGTGMEQVAPTTGAKAPRKHRRG